MAEARQPDEHARETGEPARTLKRRGLIAGAASLAAGVLAARATSPVAASQVVGTNGGAGATDTNLDGVQGYANDGTSAGVFGRNNVLNGVGVMGAAPSGIGVSGQSANGPGLSGTSTNGLGLFAQSTNYYGALGSTAKSGYAGVYGSSNNVAGAFGGYFVGSVFASAADTNGYGLQGISSHYYGVIGTSNGAYAGVLGQATVAGGYGVSAPPTSRAATRATSTAPSSSPAARPSTAPRARRSPTPTARTASSTRSRRPSPGSRMSGRRT
jgi:hypothetical protein